MQLKLSTFEKFCQPGRFAIPRLVEKQMTNFQIDGDVCTISMAELVDSSQGSRIIEEAKPEDLMDVDRMGRSALFILAFTSQTQLIPKSWITQQGLVTPIPEDAGFHLNGAWNNTPLHCIAYNGEITHLPKEFLTSANLLDIKNSAGKSPIYYLLARNVYKHLPCFSTNMRFGVREALLNETVAILNGVRAHLELAKIQVGECREIDKNIRAHAHKLTLDTIDFLTQDMSHLQPNEAWMQL